VHLDGAVHHAYYNQIFYPRRYETGRIKPYLTGGIGLAGYTLTAQARSTALQASIGDFSKLDYRFAMNYGAGIKAELGESAGVRFGFRHHFSEVPTFGVPKESGQGAFLPFDGKLQTLEASVGVYYHTTR
jgi:opacity protein-like surface antigen